MLSSALGVSHSLHAWLMWSRHGSLTQVLKLGPIDKSQNCCCLHSGNFKACEEWFRLFLLTGDSERESVTSLQGADIGGIQSGNAAQPVGSGSKIDETEGSPQSSLSTSPSPTPSCRYRKEVRKGLKCQKPTPAPPPCCVSPILSLWWNTSQGGQLLNSQGTPFCLWRGWLESSIKLDIT